MSNKAILTVGKVYKLASTFASNYRVLRVCTDGEVSAILQQVRTGWTFKAHGTNLYADDSIDWDYSSDGYFAEGFSIPRPLARP